MIAVRFFELAVAPRKSERRNKKTLCALLTQVKNIGKCETNSEQDKKFRASGAREEFEKSDQEERQGIGAMLRCTVAKFT
jgi:hypothetical protein